MAVEGAVPMKPLPPILNFVFNRSIWLYLIVAVIFAVSVNFKKAAQERTRYLLGVFYNQDLTDYNDGIVYFDYLAHKKPQDGRNYFFLGYCYLYLAQYDKALVYLERAIKLNPQEPLYEQYLQYVKSKLNKDGKEMALPSGTIQIPLE